MYTPDMMKIVKEYTNLINDRLVDLLPVVDPEQREVVKAMKYSLLNGGKRLRPILTMEFAKICGIDPKQAIDFACAVEYIHTYSLIHDDLPCMDDDELRRGEPACHIMFGEATALLAGDGLLTHAFQIVANADLPDSAKIKATSLLSQNAGACGMIGGQCLDLKYELRNPNMSELLNLHKLKTGALISAACLLGCVAADATEEQMDAASKFAYFLGIAFQIKDDILDIVGDEEQLGKPVGSDEYQEKVTYATFVGIEKAQNDVVRMTNFALEQLQHFDDTEFLETLSNYLVTREK